MTSILIKTINTMIGSAFLSMAINAQSINLQLQSDYTLGPALGSGTRYIDLVPLDTDECGAR